MGERMNNRYVYFFAVFLTVFALATTSVFAQNLSPDAAEQRRMVIATMDNSTISIDRLLHTALRNINYRVDVVTPIIRVGHMQANEGIYDGVIAAYPNIHNTYTNLLQVPVPLEHMIIRVFAVEGSGIRVNSWNDLNGLRVGLIDNRAYIPDRLPSGVTIITKPTNMAVLDGLINGEFDVAVLGLREHETFGERLNVISVGDVDRLTDYLYLNKKNEALVPQLTAALNNLFIDGTAELILQDFPMPDVNQKKTIVHILSTSTELRREDQFIAELRKPFENDMSIEWMTINLDARRYSRGLFSMPIIASLLRADILTKNVAAVVVSGDTALEFLKNYYYLYFRNIPVLFYGTSERGIESLKDLEHHYNFTGIVKNIEAYEMIENALQIFPNTKNIFVINDYTAEGVHYRNAIEESLKPLKDRLNIEYNDNLDTSSLLEQINRLPQDSLLLAGSFFVDANHQYYTISEIKRLLERYCNVPIISFYAAEVAFNAVGGKCLDYEKYGNVIAGMLQRLLNGSSAEDIPIVYDSRIYNRWVFDQLQMDIFNINPRALPAGAEIINRILPVWEANPQYFIALIILSVVSALLIIGICVFLLINNKHNKQKDRLRQEAQAASRAKSNFLANMSHEMRTPLTAVIGLTELTLETVQLDDETHSNLIKVYRAGETILNLVNDVLDISKIEADRLELNPLKYDVPSLLNDTITQSSLYLDEKPIELILSIKEDLPNYLYGDELRIKQILNNLLSNAFKFTKEGSVELGMKCEREGDTVWMTAWVRDTGVGIKPEAMGKLFTLYGRMEEENSRGKANRRTEGTGLGLSISKKVAEMMDGCITVESEYGKGSIFTVKIRQKYVSDAVIGPGLVESLKSFDYSIQKFESAKMTRINLSYAKVLVVDDNSTNLDVAKGLLGLYGMTVDCATGGQQAIDFIRDEKVRYDAVFMDHMMPEIDGIEAARIIREEIGTEYAKKIPIIALTANAIMGNEEMFLNKGFQAFIAKPIDLARLDLVLRQWVRNKEAEALLPDKIINIEVRRGKERRIQRREIPGLDMEKGIKHFGYSDDAYFKVLQSYVKNTRQLLDRIKEVNVDYLDEYAVTVHGIKGSSRGIFAQKAGDEAEALENAAKAGDFEFVSTHNDRFLDKLIKLLVNIEYMLSKSGIGQKPTKDKPDKALLDKLLDACNSFDIDEIDTLMSAIENYEYISDDGLAIWLRENIDQGKYTSVKDKLLSLTNKKEV